MANEKLRLGKVPESVFQKELSRYLKEKQSGATKATASFTYNGERFSIHGDGKGGWKLDPQARRTAQQTAREGRKAKQSVKLSSIEQKMVDNYYDEASKRGLQVDHRIPLAAGGPANAPWNLGLMKSKENQRKSDAVGGNWRYQPLIQFKNQGGSVRTTIVNTIVPGEQTSPLRSPSSAAYGGIESRSNEYVQGMTGVSPMQLPLAN